MPIISQVGSRSLKIRAIYATIFLILIVGASTMVYPFAIMIAGAMKSETDHLSMSPWPEFWFDDELLVKKYVEAKYNMKIDWAEATYRQRFGSWRMVGPSPIPTEEIGGQSKSDQGLVDEYLKFREEFDWPVGWYWLGFSERSKTYPVNTRLFRSELKQRFSGDLNALNRYADTAHRYWTEISPFEERIESRRHQPGTKGIYGDYIAFKKDRPVDHRVPVNVDGFFFRNFLTPIYGDHDKYNKSHGTNYNHLRDVRLSRSAPESGLAREDWEKFVRDELNLSFIRLRAEPRASWLATLQQRIPDIDTLNRRWGLKYSSFDRIERPEEFLWIEMLGERFPALFVELGDAPDAGAILEAAPFPYELPESLTMQSAMAVLIEDRTRCPSEAVEVYGPRQAFEDFVAARTELAPPLDLPLAEADRLDCLSRSSDWRWEFSTRNFKQVLDYILLNGRGVINTVIYCSMTIIAQLLVNPLAAYALSRFKPPSTYTILLFCMCTMAFPAEVTMIPNFLLLKRFPVWPLVVGTLVCVGGGVAIRKLAPKAPDWAAVIGGFVIGMVVGFGITPRLLEWAGSEQYTSLLNTFWALVLPGMANGFFIFLLKGFFDSLPRDLYEAADIDGAGEWTKFWTITMSLSKPILAVIALQAFTSAYSEFMMALIIIPDQDMWTIMVWLFQLQSTVHPTVVYASLIIAAVPSFGVFVLCQNIIMRGIVVPVEK
jgi:multiple sugar transport system permease protein